ncbi:MAG: CRISPR system precrRNA processing endoribonuclease RAMP protein Cas6 [Anaerolineales bacterium]|nr:CRISPR system precrRNA processing endoribonuclease RAMP protein Cas6 [Anaerolineales bacterium]
MTIYHLRFTVEARDPITFGEQPGAQLRGALYEALCAQTGHDHNQHTPENADHCPVCWLMLREDANAQRGKDVPRAFTLRPPQQGDLRQYPSGMRFQFGVTFLGQAFTLFPYVALALPEMGRKGIGATRGRFDVHAVEGVNLLTDAYEVLMQPGYNAVRRPQLCVTAEHIANHVEFLAPKQVTLRFLTPTRLIDGGEPVRTPAFRVVMGRLLERFDLIQAAYGGNTIPSPYESLLSAAAEVRLVKDDTKWHTIYSHSTRTHSSSPISGFTGALTYEGHLVPFLPYLFWGQCLQIGKDTVKGNGVMQVVV